MTRILGFTLAWIAVTVTVPVAAQEPEAASRAELLEKMREQKAQTARPYEPKGLEKILLYIDEHRLIDRLTVADGWYPTYGGPITGSGFGGGVGYRKHLLDDDLFVDVKGTLTAKMYKELFAEARYPGIEGGLVEFGTTAAWRDYPEEDFFGLGNTSLRDMRTSYAIEMTDISGHGTLKPLPWLRVGGTMGFLWPTIDRGTDSRIPSIEERFTDATAPGLAQQPDFAYRNLFGRIDYRDQPGNPRSGGLFTATYTWWSDRDLDRYSFRQLDAEAAHFFPLFDKKRVFAVRSRFMATGTGEGQLVPFYFLPYIGGSRTLRGYEEFRFRDRNLFLVNFEYRWEAFSALDMALFIDAGDVRDNWRDIDLGDLKTSYGVGFRFNTYKHVFMRLDIGRSAEGTQLFFKFGRAF
jgi:hypothetical protein